MKILVLIDGNSLMNRAYHAFKSNGKRNTEGVPMNMVWGFGKFLKGIQNRLLLLMVMVIPLESCFIQIIKTIEVLRMRISKGRNRMFKNCLN